MRSRFSLFQSHLDLAHHWWGLHLQPGDLVVDATAGNGHDTLSLARMVIPPEGANRILLHAIDFQEEAIASAQEKSKKELSPKQFACIAWHQQSHAILPCEPESVSAVIYNLGYLPGGDKSQTTQKESTLLSLEEACRITAPGGLISITCYPGHPEGEKERDAIAAWSDALSPGEWNVTWHCFSNRKRSPELLILQKKIN